MFFRLPVGFSLTVVVDKRDGLIVLHNAIYAHAHLTIPDRDLQTTVG